jgi:hypothetical protein
MTREQFDNHCDEIAYDESNENWESSAILSRIAGEIGRVALDFKSDASMVPEFGEEISNV